MSSWFQIAGLTHRQVRWAEWAAQQLEEGGTAVDRLPLVKGGTIHFPPETEVAEQLIRLVEQASLVEILPVDSTRRAGRALASRIRDGLVQMEQAA